MIITMNNAYSMAMIEILAARVFSMTSYDIRAYNPYSRGDIP
jgi:hypothetical protein